jgi:hypothetical protein
MDRLNLVYILYYETTSKLILSGLQILCLIYNITLNDLCISPLNLLFIPSIIFKINSRRAAGGSNKGLIPAISLDNSFHSKSQGLISLIFLSPKNFDAGLWWNQLIYILNSFSNCWLLDGL